MTTVAVDIYDLSDLTTPVDSLDDTALTPPNNALDVGLRGDLNDPGAGSLFVHQSHSAFAAVTRGRLLAWKFDGTPRFWTFIDSVDLCTVGEEKEKGKRVEGMGLLSYLKRAVVFPRVGVGAIPVPSDRVFSWVSNEFTDGAAPWDDAIEIFQQSATPGGSLWGGGVDGHTYPDLRMLQYAPNAWNDATAYAIGVTGDDDTNAPVGIRYFRSPGFNPGAQGFYRIEVAGSYYAGVWLDGVLLGETFSGGGTWIVELSATDHQLAIANEVTATQIDAPNHFGAVMATVIPCDESGNLTGGSPLINTTSAWRVTGYGAQPGFTVGEIWLNLVGEAQLRGALPKLVANFTETLDTNGDAFVENQLFSTHIHTDYLTVGRELVAHDFCDIWAEVDHAGDAINLNVVAKDGRGTTQAIDFTPVTDPNDPDSGNVTVASFRTVE